MTTYMKDRKMST